MNLIASIWGPQLQNSCRHRAAPLLRGGDIVKYMACLYTYSPEGPIIRTDIILFYRLADLLRRVGDDWGGRASDGGAVVQVLDIPSYVPVRQVRINLFCSHPSSVDVVTTGLTCHVGWSTENMAWSRFRQQSFISRARLIGFTGVNWWEAYSDRCPVLLMKFCLTQTIFLKASEPSCSTPKEQHSRQYDLDFLLSCRNVDSSIAQQNLH